ncbi:glycosyltransferase family 9 protein [Bowmanella dokdonensis]|uniref:Glycosyltransferase family 9 protein n=1 Tax=Bowmanella dokdonensis TaxID=751969 RepID=A0A939ITQ0_9ALTE|nr:glycosyltransferase family 9 protein [Bowmanella dokdonensis]MBN7827686.1 glycosyltransferase family 9 protein [Bowmanella dokdonensis]
MKETTLSPLISKEQLEGARRILYMTHLAIGDFVYQRAFLHALKQSYPTLQLDIWIDDCRKRKKSWHAGRNQTLIQWLESEDYIENIYPIASSQQDRESIISTANAKGYDLIVFNATQRAEQYAKYARKIGPKAFIVGTRSQSNSILDWWHFRHIDRIYRLSSQIASLHISQQYQQRFFALLGIYVPESARLYPIAVPNEFRDKINRELIGTPVESEQIIFINHLSTTEKRNYPWPKLKALLIALHQARPDRRFIINTPPAHYTEICHQLETEIPIKNLRARPFTASDFFELPAMMEACDLVISVETAVMHIASALNKPQVVLMRDSAKAWVPTGVAEILFGKGRVDNIPVEQVMTAVAKMTAPVMPGLKPNRPLR